MKIINATWEKRNLGVDTVEIVIENSDSISDVQDFLAKIHNAYTVIKLPTKRFDLIFLLQKIGYTFIEATHDISLNLKDYKLGLSPQLQKINKCVTHAPMDSDELNSLFSEIEKGLFTTDRIAINPKFGINIANKRYENWIKDELCKCNPHKIIYQGESVGFFVLKELKNNIYNPFLAGIYPEFSKRGLGLFMLIKAIEEVQALNGKKLMTVISANNVDVFNIYMYLGFGIDKTHYVFEKFN